MTAKAGRRAATATTPQRQEVWEAIRAHLGSFTVADLAARSGANRKTVKDYLRCLLPGGIIQAEGEKGIRENLRRKQVAADRMFEELVNHMNDALHMARGVSFPVGVEVPSWA